MMKKRLGWISAVWLVGLGALQLVPTVLHAQSPVTATIAGTVTDQTGAMVPDAAITIIDEATGTTTKTSSNIDGSYVAPNLIMGSYTVTTEKSGFETFTEKGISLRPAIVTTVNTKLSIGAAAQKIEVTAAPAIVETSVPDVSNSVEADQIHNLPMNGRNYQSLAQLMPGVTVNGLGSSLNTGGRNTSTVINVAGEPFSRVLDLMDGAWNSTWGSMGENEITPNPDAIQEVRVLEHNYSVEYTLMGGAAVLTTIKSGGSQFHGTAWEYLRNTDLNARNFFSTTIPSLKQNLFGAGVGGPVVIPHLFNTKRQNTFFYANLSFVVNHSQSTTTGIIPSAFQRAGCFASSINNPATGTLFPSASGGSSCPVGYTQLPSVNINSSASKFVNTMYPAPNYSNGLQNYINYAPLVTNQHDAIVKIDQNFGAKLHLSGDYFGEYQTYDQNSAGGQVTHVNWEDDIWNKKGVVATLTQTLAPTMTNRTTLYYLQGPLYLNMEGVWQVSQLPGYSQSLPFGGAGSNRLPSMNFGGSIAPSGTTSGRPITAIEEYGVGSDDWAWLKGHNYFQAGFQLIVSTKRQTVFAAAQGSTASNGTFTFNGTATAPTAAEVSAGATKNVADESVADFLLGYVDAFSQVSSSLYADLIVENWFPYFQDQFKMGKNLTITLGARLYHMQLAHSVVPGQELNFIPSAFNPSYAPTVAYSTGLPSNFAAGGLTNGVYTNGLLRNNGQSGQLPLEGSTAHQLFLGPQGGFAWDVFGDGKTSLRGGFGMSYTTIISNQDCSFYCIENPPTVNSTTLNNLNLSGTSSFNVAGATGGTSNALTLSSLYAMDQNIHPTEVMSYSLGVEHEFPRNWVAAVTAAGTQSRFNNVSFVNINAPAQDGIYDFNPLINFDPTCNGTQTSGPGCVPSPYYFAKYQGYSSIQTLVTKNDQSWTGLETSLTHPMSNNLYVTAAYTWSHDLADMPINPNFVKKYHGSYEGYDIRQVFAVSGVYNLPSLAHSRHLVQELLGGWCLSDITNYRTGIASGLGLSMVHQGLASRPDRVPGTSVYGTMNRSNWLNKLAFANPQPGYYGNAALGSYTGPHLIDFDTSISKDFKVTEGSAFQFRAEAFNTFNHTNFSGWGTTFGVASFGQMTSAFDPRIMEFALRYEF